MKKHFKFWMSLTWSDRLAALLFWLLVIFAGVVLSGCAVLETVRLQYDSDTGGGSVTLPLPTLEGGAK